MKNILVFILILLVFASCALFGFSLAGQFDLQPVEPTPTLSSGGNNNPHYLVLLQVDSLSAPQPVLVSAWFMSFYFLESHPPTLTFKKIYPSPSNAERNLALEHSFVMNETRDPAADFWNAFQPFQIQWEGYMIIDQEGANQVFAWLSQTPGLEDSAKAAMTESPDDVQRLKLGCLALTMQSDQANNAFDWHSLFPDHFHSNLRIETALAYWNQTMNAGMPLRCEVFPAE